MSPGKVASQAGHAYLGSYLNSLISSPTNAHLYSQEAPGTKVCLKSNLDKILQTKEILEQNKIPHFLVVDSGCANFFNGEPTITALGVGPINKKQGTLLKKFKLYN